MRVGTQIELCKDIKKEELETYVQELNRDLKEKRIAQGGTIEWDGSQKMSLKK